MSFFQQVCEFRKLFRDIEKLTIKCVHLKCGVENIYIYIYIANCAISCTQCRKFISNSGTQNYLGHVVILGQFVPPKKFTKF